MAMSEGDCLLYDLAEAMVTAAALLEHEQAAAEKTPKASFGWTSSRAAYIAKLSPEERADYFATLGRPSAKPENPKEQRQPTNTQD